MNKVGKKLLHIMLGISAISMTTTIQAENLIEVYSLAISSDPQLQSSYATRLSTREAFPSALAGFLPSLGGNASLSSSDSDYPADLGLTNVSGITRQTLDRNQQYNAAVNQTIFDLSRWHTLKQSRQTVSYADAVYMASEQDLIIRTASAYFNLLNAMDQLAFIQAEKRALGRQLDQTQEKFNVGLVAITDVKDIQAQYDGITAEEIAASNNVDNTRQELKILTGQMIEDVDGLNKLPLNSPEPFNIDEWAIMAEQYNPTLQASKYLAETKKSAISIAKDQYLPVIEYNGTYGRIRGGTPGTPIGDWEKQWTSNVQGTVNLFSGGAIASNVRRAQYDHQASLQNLEQVRRDTETNTRNAFRNVMAAIGQVNAFSRAVESGNASLEATIAGYDVGTRTSVDLLVSISNLYQQESSLATARYNYILSILQLKLAAGTLNTEDVYLVNGWLAKGRKQATDIIESVPGASGTMPDSNIQGYEKLKR